MLHPPTATLFPYTTLFRSSFYATDESCTHAYASLVDGYIDGEEVECSLHGARFSIPTGEVLAEPATENLATYRSEEHTSELQSRFDLVCRLLLEKKNINKP